MGVVRLALFILFLQLFLPGARPGSSILGFFPFPGKSHHKIFGPLMNELAKRGHNVTYFTPIPYIEPHTNLNQVIVGNYGPEVLGTIDFLNLGQLSIPIHLHLMYDKLMLLLSKVLKEKNVKDLIHSNDKFHAVIIESFFFQEATSALVHKFGAVGIDIVPLGDFVWVSEVSGFTVQCSFMSDYKTFLTDDMSFSERVYNTLTTVGAITTSYWNMRRMQALMDKHFDYSGWETRPPLTKLMSNKSIILVNKDPYLGFPQPTAPHVKEIGGINVIKNKPLPKHLKKFMDAAQNGVIYMSLGLNMQVSDMLKNSVMTFMKIFGSLKQRVLLKWEVAYEGRIPPNVLVSQAFPQQDVLAHDKVVIFITHGGILSLSEAAYHGVPVIGIPFYGDQPKNILWAQSAGVGLHLDYNNLTESSIKWAINEIIRDPRYKTNMKRRSQMVRSRPQTPMDRAIYWIEESIKYPYALTPKSAYQDFWVLHQFDVISFIFAYFSLKTFIFYKIMRFAVKLLFTTSIKEKKN